jgi:hypothetical protein
VLVNVPILGIPFRGTSINRGIEDPNAQNRGCNGDVDKGISEAFSGANTVLEGVCRLAAGVSKVFASLTNDFVLWFTSFTDAFGLR